MGKIGKRLFNSQERWKFEPKPCDNPTESEKFPSVCTCGAALDRHTLGSHKELGMKPYREAVWAWLLKNGGSPSYYGGFDEGTSEEVLRHMINCSVDYERSDDPHLQKFSEFNGTFESEPYYVDLMLGTLHCKCGWINQDNLGWRAANYDGGVVWGLRSAMTIGEMIFQVVKEGEA